MSTAACVTVTTRKITMHGFQQEKRYYLGCSQYSRLKRIERQ